MTYIITQYTKSQAAKLGVTVKPSTNPKKKIDVYKDGKKIASCGAMGYGDFPTYAKEKGIEYALERRRLYHLRHKKDNSVNAAMARALLW